MKVMGLDFTVTPSVKVIGWDLIVSVVKKKRKKKVKVMGLDFTITTSVKVTGWDFIVGVVKRNQ